MKRGLMAVHTRVGPGVVTEILFDRKRPIYVVKLDGRQEAVRLTLPDLWKREPGEVMGT